MALEAGTCVVNTDKSVSGTGLAVAIGAAHVAGFTQPHIPPFVATAISGFAERIGAAIIDYLLANAEIAVTVKTTDAGLQRDPASSDPTLAPSADKTINGSLT